MDASFESLEETLISQDMYTSGGGIVERPPQNVLSKYQSKLLVCNDLSMLSRSCNYANFHHLDDKISLSQLKIFALVFPTKQVICPFSPVKIHEIRLGASDSGSATARYVVGIERQGDAGGDGMGREF